MAFGYVFVSLNLVLYSDWSRGIVSDDVVFKGFGPHLSLQTEVSIETACNHFEKKHEHHLKA